tara:strand:- start:592 stop:1224 length:633 start_codon:yes stop_codon:yes gene_type:complete
MIVMPSANTGFDCGVFFGKYPDRMGHLFTPIDKNGEPRTEYKWAIDNGVFGAWNAGEEWSGDAFYSFLEKYSWLNPEWVAVPDWVADREMTLSLWEKHSPAIQAFGLPMAFVAQDGMTPDDVPSSASVVFMGGSTEWKWKNLTTFTANFPRVHVGRVNAYRLLWMAHEAGAESCDGTGWFRGNRKQLAGLERYLTESQSANRAQSEMELT